VLTIAVIGYLAAVAYLFVFQRDYVFVPSGTLATPAEKGLPHVEVVTIRVRDGMALTGWYARPSADRPTVLYFHGNSGNISGRADRFKQILDSGFGLLAVSYRGYPGSGGSPSQDALFSDGLEIFDWLAARTTRIVVHGESLGTSVATYVACERPARALVLEAPFTAALDVAAKTYPWVPVSLLMRDPFPTRDMIVKIGVPVLIVHGTNDETVPVAEGQELFELAHEPKKLAIIDGASHGDLWDHGLWPIVLGFLTQESVTRSP
jgi:fermentation-respiration switch protein FrsA (DUF1100 family)